MRIRGIYCLLSLWIAGCHVAPLVHDEPWDALSDEKRRERIVDSARAFLGAREIGVEGKSFSADCSGFVGAVLYQNGFLLEESARALSLRGNGVRILRDFVVRSGQMHESSVPQAGELVFFSNTYDRNRDGKWNDPLTHIGIVERVDPDGTVQFLHYMHSRVRRDAMNLHRPGQFRDGDGIIVNDYLRQRRRRDPKNSLYLAAQLFDGFGSLLAHEGAFLDSEYAFQ